MKIIIIIIFVFQGCNSISSFNRNKIDTIKRKEINSVYYIDNFRAEKEINSIGGCNGLAEAIRNNFFFNKSDSIYVLNLGFFIHGLSNDYYDCLSNLTESQIVSLFGPPHFVGDGSLHYIIKNGISKNSAAFTFQPNATIPFDYSKNIIDKIDNILGNIESIINSKRFKEAKQIKKATDYCVNHNIVIRNSCKKKKDVFDQEVLYHRNNNYFIVNFLLTLGLENMNMHEVPCLESFTKKELESLFGKPSYVKSDTLFYILYDNPFISRTERNSHYNGMYYSVFFNKLSTNLYKYNAGMVKKRN